MDSKRVVGGLVAIGGVALAGEWVVRGADRVLTFFYQSGTVDWGALRNVIGLVALAAGAYLLLRPSKSRDEKLTELAGRMNSVLASLEDHSVPETTMGQIIAVYLSLDDFGIPTPSTSGAENPARMFQQASDFLRSIAPIINAGHLHDARLEAIPIIQAAKGIPTKPGRWPWQRKRRRL
jgi:hypothetical protein